MFLVFFSVSYVFRLACCISQVFYNQKNLINREKLRNLPTCKSPGIQEKLFITRPTTRNYGKFNNILYKISVLLDFRCKIWHVIGQKTSKLITVGYFLFFLLLKTCARYKTECGYTVKWQLENGRKPWRSQGLLFPKKCSNPAFFSPSHWWFCLC